jgi:hypothetical protein
MKMFEFEFSEDAKQISKEIVRYVKEWCAEHQWEIGVTEMAAGAAILSWGIQTGAIEVGKHAVATRLADGVPLAGGVVGGGMGAFAASMIGSIGVAGMGTAIGIPAAVLIGGGALFLGAFGYSVSDLGYRFLNRSVDLSSALRGTSLVALGTLLMIDGVRRFIGDERIRNVAISFKNWVLNLPLLKVEIVADSLEKLKRLIDEIAALPEDSVDALGNAFSIAGGAAAGAAIGSSIAASSVTVLGSHFLGGVALSLGLVSAPLWPVVLTGAVGAGAAHVLWKSCKGWGENWQQS